MLRRTFAVALSVLAIVGTSRLAFAEPKAALNVPDAPVELKPETQLALPVSSVTALAFSPDGQLIATGGGTNAGVGWEDCVIRLWRASDGKLLAKAPGHQKTVSSIALTTDGRRMASCCSADRAIKIWDLSDLWAK